MRYAGPVVIVMVLILGMYSRRYSPLSSSAWTGEKKKKGHKREESEITNIKHQKTLDEIVETLKVFTSRCNVLLDPLLELTDFLSTQRTATSATTRPALTTLLIRILLVTPLWVVLTLRPFQIITTKRLVLVGGTLFLTWHSRPNRVSRAILWRSALVRRICGVVTGLHLTDTITPLPQPEEGAENPPLPPRQKSTYQEEALSAATTAAKRRPDAPGVKFTFILYENQRRWVGLGWTTSLFAYERAPWTDDYLNPAPAKDDFELPDVEDGAARWRWSEGSKWLVEGAKEFEEGGSKAKEGATEGGQGWIYYDNKVMFLPTFLHNININLSGKRAAEVKMAGDATPVAENGTETRNWLRSPPPPKSHPRQPQHATLVLRPFVARTHRPLIRLLSMLRVLEAQRALVVLRCVEEGVLGVEVVV